jgi:hypothetical protein
VSSVANHNEVPPRLAEGPLWLKWVLANSAGGLVGWSVGGVIAGALSVFIVSQTIGLGHPGWLAIVWTPMAGAIAGYAVGGFQGLVLERHMTQIISGSFAKNWLRATTLGIGLGFTLFSVILLSPFPLSKVLASYFAVLVGSLVLSLAQWLVLRRYLNRSGWWIPANLAGWMLGLTTASISLIPLFQKADNPDGTFVIGPVILFFFILNLVTVVASIISGLVLIWLLRVTALKGV